MWWKVYFWAYIGLVLFGYYRLIPVYGEYWLPAIIIQFLIFSLIIIVGLYSYVYKKRILPSWVWAVLFWISLVIFVFNTWYFFNYRSIEQEAIKMVGIEKAKELYKQAPDPINLLYSIVAIPLYYALFKLGYPKIKLNSPEFKKRLWKIYFWILTVLTVIGIIGMLQTITTWNLALWISSIENIILVIGVYSYVFGKSVINKTIWRSNFLLLVAVEIICLIYAITKLPVPSFLQANIPEVTTSAAIFATITVIPAVLANYRLGFAPKKK